MQLFLGNYFFTAYGVAAVANANFSTVEQLACRQSCQGCKENKLKVQFGLR